jgi:hypothetical protein
MSAFFDKNVAAWTDTLLADFMCKRYRLMTLGPGTICTPGHPSLPAYAPFQADDYTHAKLLGNLADPSWRQIRATPARKLLHPNPFELSPFRQSDLNAATPVYKFRCWDSAVGIRACTIRSVDPKPFNAIQVVRDTNEHWNGVALPSILRTGPLGKGGALLRPRGKHIFDLTRTKRDFSFDLLEMAHVMAHQYDEVRSEHRYHSQYLGRTAGRYRGALAEIVHAIMYGLPIDVSLRDRGKPGEPDTYYKTELKSTTDFRNPVLRLPWKTAESARPDDTLSVALNAIFIQPHPHGFTTGTGAYELDDMWCCSPTIIALTGWEGIDFITHQAVGYNPYDRRRKGSYVVPAPDLLPPDTYWAYLALAQRTDRGDGAPLFIPPDQAVAATTAAIQRAAQAEEAILADTRLGRQEQEERVLQAWQAERPNIRWVYPHDWLSTGHYRWLYAQTPSLPCKYCIDINRHAEGAPERPKGHRPKGKRKDWPQDWIRWEQDLSKILAIVKNAVVAYERKRYGTKKARVMRTARTKAAHARYKRISLVRQANEVITKQRRGVDPTAAEWSAYYRVYDK